MKINTIKLKQVLRPMVREILEECVQDLIQDQLEDTLYNDKYLHKVVQEMVFKDGTLSTIIKEVAVGLNGVIGESHQERKRSTPRMMQPKRKKITPTLSREELMAMADPMDFVGELPGGYTSEPLPLTEAKKIAEKQTGLSGVFEGLDISGVGDTDASSVGDPFAGEDPTNPGVDLSVFGL